MTYVITKPTPSLTHFCAFETSSLSEKYFSVLYIKIFGLIVCIFFQTQSVSFCQTRINLCISCELRKFRLQQHQCINELQTPPSSTLQTFVLTKVLALDWRNAPDMSLDKKVDVWDYDEGRWQAWPWLVLHDQVITLILPVGVTVLLHFGEGVTADSKTSRDMVLVWTGTAG